MSWTLSTSGAAILKAGANANATIIASAASLATWSDEAEGTLSTMTRKDWVTDYSTIKTNFKPILSDVVSDMVAMKIINYDMSGYTSRTEAQTMLDFLDDNVNAMVKILNEDNKKENMIT